MSMIFFFFQEQTAYVFRISDWSSDVCSSDLCWNPCKQVLFLRFQAAWKPHYCFLKGRFADRKLQWERFFCLSWKVGPLSSCRIVPRGFPASCGVCGFWV